MDFLELWFGISPDGGNGTLELVLLTAPLVAALCRVALRSRRAARL